MKYSPHTANGKGLEPTILNNHQVLQLFSRYKISDGTSFVPEKLEIREKNPRKEEEDSRRILLLGKDKLHYRVLKFAHPDAGATEDEDISMS